MLITYELLTLFICSVHFCLLNGNIMGNMNVLHDPNKGLDILLNGLMSQSTQNSPQGTLAMFVKVQY